MPPETRTNSDTIVSFLKSPEFSKIIKIVVKEETQTLHEKIEKLENEVKNLRESNIDLVKLLTGNISQQVKLRSDASANSNQQSKMLNSYSKVVETIPQEGSKKGKEIRQGEEIVVEQKTLQQKKQVNKQLEGLSDEKWEFPKKSQWRRNFRNRRSGPIYGSAAENELPFKGVVKYTDYHVYRLPPKLCETDIVDYLLSRNINEVKCEKMKARYPEEYSSFKISVSLKQEKQFRNPNIWPEYCVVNHFLHKIPTKNKED